jgi:sulfite reductase (NADPH) flavoprotein alpha-component
MPTLNVLFGTESGNSEKLAQSIERTAKEIVKQAGEALKFDVAIKNLKDVKVADLTSMEHAVVVISTWGEGDPPGTCKKFCEELFADKSTDLSKLNYTVFAMGDKSYQIFCGCGKQVDESFSRLGAKAFMARHDSDLDYDAGFEPWEVKMFTKLAPMLK